MNCRFKRQTSETSERVADEADDAEEDGAGAERTRLSACRWRVLVLLGAGELLLRVVTGRVLDGVRYRPVLVSGCTRSTGTSQHG